MFWGPKLGLALRGESKGIPLLLLSIKYELYQVGIKCEDLKLPFLGRTKPLHPLEPKRCAHKYRAVSEDEGHVWDRFGGPRGALQLGSGFGLLGLRWEITGDQNRLAL